MPHWRTVTLRVVALLVSVFALAGCSSGTEETGTSAATATAATTPAATPAATTKTPSPTWNPPADMGGNRVCTAVKAVESDPFQADPAAMVAAAKEGKTSTASTIRTASASLANTAAATLVAVKAGKAEADVAATRLPMGTNVLELLTACTKGGYYPPLG
jgi:hypothetical protein